MTRDPERLTHTPFDLLVVGGGIHGLFAAYDAAKSGLSVALVDRADFGSGLSFNHQRTIHGGLRGLQHGELSKTRQQIDERRTWACMAPHLIRPLPFLIGTYGWTTRSRWALRAGLWVYDKLGRRRNSGITPELHIPRARLESAAATRRLFPGIAEPGLTGGAIWYDYQTRHPDRLTWTVALAAEAAGASLLNYAEALGPIRNAAGQVSGARVRDVLTGAEMDVPASVTLLAAGAGLPSAMRAFGATGAPPLLRAMNVLLSRPARDIATAARGGSGRMLTAVPWQGCVLVGTDQSAEPISEDGATPSRSDVERFLADLNEAFPRLKATLPDVRLVHHGLTPAAVRNGKTDLLSEPQVTVHKGGADRLITLAGVKYTTARWAAERAIDAVFGTLGRSRPRCQTARVALPYAEIADAEGRLLETARELRVALDRDVFDHLVGWYGTEGPAVLRYASSSGLMDRLSPATSVLAGEIAYAVERSAAVRLGDAVLRRTPLGSAGHPGEALPRAGEIMATRAGWTGERRAREIADVEAVYPVY